MVAKRGKKIELRKRKETEKEKQAKDRQKKSEEFKEALTHLRLNITILLLIGANFLFLISFLCHSRAREGAEQAITPNQLEGLPAQRSTHLIKVEVLNGCGTPGVAKQLTEYLRQREVDVVYFGNFENQEISETLVIDRQDPNLKNAKIIGDLIGVGKDRMFPQISPQRQLAVTIIIGKNYSQLKAFQ